MKKFIALCLAAILICSSFCAYANDDEISVFIDGYKVEFDVAPKLINDRTMVPMRKIFEILGYTVEWEESEQKITAKKDETVLVLQIDSCEITKNGETLTTDVPPMISGDTTFVPLRTVSECAGCKVAWNEATSAVFISTNSKESERVTYDEFLAVKIGDTYEHVADIFGSGGGIAMEADTIYGMTRSYVWENAPESVQVIFANGKLLAKDQHGLYNKTCDRLTKAEFDSLAVEMSYNDVKTLLKSEGELKSEGKNDIGKAESMYEWKDALGGLIDITFIGDKLAEKGRANLE